MARYRTLAEYLEHHSQKEVAEKLGVAPSYISMLASGKRTPRLKIANAIHKLTGVPLAALDYSRSR